MSMKGALQTLTDYMYLVVAIAIAGLMFYFVIQYSGLFSPKVDDTVFGDAGRVSQRIAKEIELCWSKHRGGLDANSDICTELKVNSTHPFYERTVTDFLDCSRIPNNHCPPYNCSFCASKSYSDNDKVEWNVSRKDALIEISYSGHKRKIIVREITVPKENIPNIPSDNTNSGNTI